MERNLPCHFENDLNKGKVRIKVCFCHGLTRNSDGAGTFVRIMESSK